MVFQNKWNNKLYEFIKTDNNKITLKRLSDEKLIEIDKSEFNFSYRENKKDFKPSK